MEARPEGKPPSEGACRNQRQEVGSSLAAEAADVRASKPDSSVVHGPSLRLCTGHGEDLRRIVPAGCDGGFLARAEG